MPGQVTRGSPVLNQRFSQVQETETFGESDVTVTHTDTEVSGGSVILSQLRETTSRDADNGSGSYTGKHGFVINPNTDLDAIEGTLSSNTGSPTTAYIYSGDGTSQLASTSIGGSSFSIDYSLSAGTDYMLVCDDGGNTYTAGYDNTPSTPYTGAYLDITDGVYGLSTTTALHNIVDVTGVVDASNGSVTIDWDDPDDVFAHGYVNYQTSPDGEAVTVDVEEHDGSSWVTVATDVSRGGDISAADSANPVRLVANLSRSDTANVPTLDYAAKSYIQ